MREDESVLRLFGGLISEEEYQEVKNKAIHPVHPLVALLRDEGDVIDSTGFTLMTKENTKCSIEEITRLDRGFLEKNKKRILSCDRTESSSLFGEIRCYGMLLKAFGKDSVHHIKERENVRTSDFLVEVEKDAVYIEVKTVMMSEKEIAKLQENGVDYKMPSGIKLYEKEIFPYGIGKKGAGITPSVIYKLCSIKQDLGQLSEDKPSILWVDLQDEYVNALGDRIKRNGPLFLFQSKEGVDRIFSNELWYSVYAQEGMKVFQGEHQNQNEGIQQKVETMKISGRFYEDVSKKLSAIIYYGPNGAVMFENTAAINPLPIEFKTAFASLSKFDCDVSRMNYEGKSIDKEIKNDIETINALGEKKFYSW